MESIKNGSAAGLRVITRRAAMGILAAAPAWAKRRAPLFEQVELFRQGEAGVHTYRIPALVETRRGTLIAVADARHDSTSDMPARISLVMRRSRDGGKTWSAALTIRAVKEGGVGDASLLVDPRRGRVWCFHSYGPPGIGFGTAQPGALTGPTTFQFHAISSDDEGATWSQPVDLTPQVKEREWQAMFATSGTHFATSRGRFLVPLVTRDGAGVVSSRNAYSDDGGLTWKAGAFIGRDTDESKAVELADGSVLQNMRLRNSKVRAQARSTDGGVTFAPMQQVAALVDPVCNAGLARYRHGGRDLLLFTNAASVRRENVTIKVSADGGRTWSAGRALHPGPGAYSTVIPLRDGTIGVMYECGEKTPVERIRFARCNLEWVEG